MLFARFNGQLTAIWLLASIFQCSSVETVHSNGTSASAATRNGVSSGRSRNDHDEIKSLINHVVAGVMQKIDVNQAIYVNELSSMADVIIGSFGRSLRELNARMQTLEMLSHQIDELTDYKNNVDTKLFRLSENTEANQMLNVRLNDLQHSVDYVRLQMDHIIEKTVPRPIRTNKAASMSATVSDVEATLASGEQNAANCETKIDQVISFVHNFAEINRLESSDILNRLSNMQTQLIHFFDADKANAKMHIHPNSREKVTRNKTITSLLHIQATTEAIQMDLTTSADVLLSNVTDLSDNSTAKHEEFEVDSRVERNALNTVREHGVPHGSPHQLAAHRSAKYGLPTHFGCHQSDNSKRSDGFYRFDAIESNHNAAGRNFNEQVCSFGPHGAGWTVIQQRGQQYQPHGPESFNRSWADYKNGFGDLRDGEFWWGNDFIHQLTYDNDMELKILLQNWAGHRIEFYYDIFRVDSERNKYNLMIDGFRGDNKSLDAMAYHNGQDFSTFDRQNDRTEIDGNRGCCSCATSYASGWWFNNCLEANLNGVYRKQPNDNNFVGIVWEHWLGDYSLKSTKMMVRPKIEWNNDVDESEVNPSSRPPDDP